MLFSESLKSSVKGLFSKRKSLQKFLLEKLLDLFAIILSIYLALNIEGWAEKKEEHKRLDQYYHNLLSEIEKDTVTLSEVIINSETHIKNCARQQSLLKEYQVEVEDTVLKLFSGMMSSVLFYTSNMVSYRSMVVSGDIKLIENIEVREKLIQLEEMYTGLRLIEDMYLEFMKKDLISAVNDNFDLPNGKLINKNFFNNIRYRNFVANYEALNTNRLDQYNKALSKAKETQTVILRDLNKR